MSGLEIAYWLALGVGLAILVLSVAFGGVLEIFEFDIGDVGVPFAPLFFGSIAAFGAGGLIGVEAFDLGTAGSIAAGLVTGVVVGVLIGLLFVLLHKQEADEPFALADLVGQRGRSTLAIGPGRTGKVSVHYAGMTRSLTATSVEEIAAGEEVVVLDIVGTVLTVARATQSQASPQVTEDAE